MPEETVVVFYCKDSISAFVLPGDHRRFQDVLIGTRLDYLKNGCSPEEHDRYQKAECDLEDLIYSHQSGDIQLACINLVEVERRVREGAHLALCGEVSE